MIAHSIPFKSFRGSQRGTAVIEFALVALIFFTLVFGIMEFGRLLFIWNSVQEVTRRAARGATVGDFTSEVDAIQRNAIFQGGSTGSAYLPAGHEISSLMIRINYLNGSLADASPLPIDPADNLSACNDVTRASSCIRYVEACVAKDAICSSAVSYIPMSGLFPFLAIDIPVSSVVMPAESLGFNTSP